MHNCPKALPRPASLGSMQPAQPPFDAGIQPRGMPMEKPWYHWDLDPVCIPQPMGTVPEQNSAAGPGVCSTAELCTGRPSKMCQVSWALGIIEANERQSSWLNICRASIKSIPFPSGACSEVSSCQTALVATDWGQHDALSMNLADNQEFPDFLSMRPPSVHGSQQSAFSYLFIKDCIDEELQCWAKLVGNVSLYLQSTLRSEVRGKGSYLVISTSSKQFISLQ